MNGFGTLNEYHYEGFSIVVIMILIIQTHCHLLQPRAYRRYRYRAAGRACNCMAGEM